MAERSLDAGYAASVSSIVVVRRGPPPTGRLHPRGESSSGLSWRGSLRCPAPPITFPITTKQVWGNVKATELANLCPDTLDEAHAAADAGLHRIGTTYSLCFAFLNHTGLSLRSPSPN